MISPGPQGPIRPFRLLCWLYGPVLLTGCATKPAPATSLLLSPAPAVLRAPCPRPERPSSPTVGELAGFSVEQQAALAVCESRKDAAVAILDAGAMASAALAIQLAPKRRWWRVWQ